MGVLLFLIFIFFGIPGFIAWGIRSSIQNDKKRKIELDKEAEEWIKEQNKLSKYFVRVKTKSGATYETEPVEPETDIKYFLEWELFVCTSLDNAKERIRYSIKNEAFTHNGGKLYIPTCEIETMEVVETKGEGN